MNFLDISDILLKVANWPLYWGGKYKEEYNMKFKRFKYAALAAAVVASAAIVPALDSSAATAGWKQDKAGRWWYQKADGTYAQKEFINGYWLRGNGYWDLGKKSKWHQDAKGWWFGYDDASWYGKQSWWKINGKWYCFDQKGYAVTDGFVKGYYLNDDGIYDERLPRYGWHQQKTGDNAGKWWYGKDGQNYVANGWYKIDGMTYYFDEDGWLYTWRVAEIDGVVYGFNSVGTAKEYTAVTPAETIAATLKFELTEENMLDAAQDMNDVLVMYTAPGTTKNMKFNGKTKTITHVESGDDAYIAVDGEPLVDYVARVVKAGSFEVTGSGNVQKLLEKIEFVADNAESKSYNYSITINGVEFTKFRFNGSVDAINFTAEGNNYTGIVDLDGNTAYILTDITGTDAFAVLNEAGVISDASVQKPAHPWWQ